MPHAVEVENIEALRRREGIEDAELREAIRALRVGDRVKLTLLTGPEGGAGETLVVRITRIRGAAFRGEHRPGRQVYEAVPRQPHRAVAGTADTAAQPGDRARLR